MTELSLTNKIKDLTNTSEFTRNFMEQFKGCFEVKSRFNSCQEIIEIKVKSVTPVEDGIWTLEFASEEDAKLYWDNYQKVPIRMTFV